MTGNNTLLLCPLQMQVIVQEWVERNIASNPQVTAVNGGRDGFEVHLEPRKERPK